MTSLMNVNDMLEQMSKKLGILLKQRKIDNPVMIGIHTGGVWIAEKLHEMLNIDEELGKLGISFYRDDFSKIGLHPEVKASSLPFDVENRDIILVDDVLFSGRTVRAALNEIFDFGRPSSVILTILLDRGSRELPIQPDIVGQRIRLNPKEHIKLSGPEPLALSVHDE